MTYNTPQDLLDGFIHAYGYERNMEATLACLSDDIEWVGTEYSNIIKGKEALRKDLEKEFIVFPNPIYVELDQSEVRLIGEDAAVITYGSDDFSTKKRWSCLY